VIDELVECLDKDGLDKNKDKKEIELIDTISSNITKLARLSRAVNINMVLGTQLPTSSCLGNQLKNNIVGRLCGRFADESASRVVLSSTKAKELPDTKGRMMYKLGADIVEVQTPFINNSFIKYYLKENKDLLKLVEIGEQKEDKEIINLTKNDKVIQGNFNKSNENESNKEVKKEKNISLEDLKNMKIK
jgi:S-DNA-T family DNA segregation ATPase FtsK/SpoIIIE